MRVGVIGCVAGAEGGFAAGRARRPARQLRDLTTAGRAIIQRGVSSSDCTIIAIVSPAVAFTPVPQPPLSHLSFGNAEVQATLVRLHTVAAKMDALLGSLP